MIREGTPLEILCVLSEPMYEGRYHNASDLRLYHNKTLVGPEHLTIVNETTLRYYVARAPAMMAFFYCKLKVRPAELRTTSKELRQREPEAGVCFNTVMVGCKWAGEIGKVALCTVCYR